MGRSSFPLLLVSVSRRVPIFCPLVELALFILAAFKQDNSRLVGKFTAIQLCIPCIYMTSYMRSSLSRQFLFVHARFHLGKIAQPRLHGKFPWMLGSDSQIQNPLRESASFLTVYFQLGRRVVVARLSRLQRKNSFFARTSMAVHSCCFACFQEVQR